MSTQEFDLEDYIKQRLTEITDADERSFAKEVLLKGLLPAFRTMEERYRELEGRVKREIEVDNRQFAVMTMVIRGQDYDPTNRTWFPVCPNDRSVYFLGTEQQKRAFEAAELTAHDPQGGTHQVGIRRTPEYRRAVEELYRVFVYNRIPWNTVNTGQLDRFYEVFALDGAEITEDWDISFGAWEDRVRTGCMAVWNVEKFYFRCSRFMVPSLDGKYYEHELDLAQYDRDSGYMVGCSEDILSIRYEKDRIIMTSLKETFDKWPAYRFGGRTDNDSYGYGGEILSNRREQGFADWLAKRRGRGIHSKTELFRILEGLCVGEHIRLLDLEIREQEREGSFSADMNWFIREELFPLETRRILELQFAGQGDGSRAETYRTEDMLRYAVSQMQLILDEYKCVGVLM